MTKRHKVELLRDILTGKADASELLPVSYPVVWLKGSDTSEQTQGKVKLIKLNRGKPNVCTIIVNATGQDLAELLK